jgi:hypothetical protein
LYEKSCGTCHEPGSAAFQEGRKIKDILLKARKELEDTRAVVRQAAIEGIFVEEEEAFLEEAKSKVLEMKPLQHTLSYKKIAAVYAESKTKTDEIAAGIKEKRDGLKWRKTALIPVWLFILGMVFALVGRFKKLKAALKQKEEGPHES